MPTLTPTETTIEICYKCKCGYVYWFPPGQLKYGQRFECDCCSKELNIEPTKPVVIYEAISSQEPNTVVNKVSKILKSQGFSISEVNKMIDEVDFNTDNVSELVRKALSTHS